MGLDREKRRLRHKKYLEKDPKHTLFMRAKYRAKEDNSPFTITENDFEIPSHCPLLNIPIFFHPRIIGSGRGSARAQDNAMSLDKIDPTLGYVPGNVRVISFLANSMKRNATREQLIAFANNILKG